MIHLMQRVSFLWLLPLLASSTAWGQANFNIPNDTQSTVISSGFGQNNQTSFNVAGPGWSYSSNLNVTSSVGTPVIGQGISTGIGFGGNGIHGNLGLSMAQGSSQFMGGITQSLTHRQRHPWLHPSWRVCAVCNRRHSYSRFKRRCLRAGGDHLS